MISSGVLCLASAPALLFGSGLAESGFSLNPDGSGPVTIVAPKDSAVDEAVGDLGGYLEKITGRSFPVLRVEDETGSSAGAVIVLQLGEGPEEEGGFNFEVTEQELRISSRSADGLYFGVTELLEQLGVRWFLPGPMGTVVPQSANPHLKLQKDSHIPSFASRYFGPTGDKVWDKRMRFGGLYFPPAHGISIGKDVTFEDHPEFFAEVDGKRIHKQLCLSNPEVLRLAVVAAEKYFAAHPDKPLYGLGPNDGSNFCECANCRALDSGEWDAFTGAPVLTDRYIWFFNQMLEQLKDSYPERGLAFYAYHTYMEPPTKVVPNPLIVPALAPIALCRIHGMNNPVCPDRSYYKQLMEGWTKLLPRVFERGYWFNLADPGFPFSSVHRMRDEILAAKSYGIYGWRTETICHWASELPSHYVAAKLMWDVDTDVDALLEDFYEKFFGPAAGPMKVYFETMDHALRDSDHHTGGAFGTPLLYPEKIRRQAGEALAKAGALASENPYHERVEIVSLSFAYLEHFVAAQAARNLQDWDKAQQEWQKLEGTRDKLVAFEPPMIKTKLSRSYLDRFFRLPIEQGFQRSHEGNEVVASLGENWDFLPDPSGVGEDVGWYAAGLKGGNWQQVRPYETSWSDIGLHYYRGLAWYRQKVEIAQKWEGRRIFLWFGGVDETARVWVNGEEVGVSADAAFIPFEFDASESVRFGAENVVTVCVANNRTDEIGTGGLMAPAMFFAPAAGDKAEPENVRPLRETFP